MIKEKYTQLLLSRQVGGITTISVTYKLYARLQDIKLGIKKYKFSLQFQN